MDFCPRPGSHAPPARLLQVGWWDPEVSAWSTAGVTEVQLDRGSASLSFRTCHMGVLAVLQVRDVSSAGSAAWPCPCKQPCLPKPATSPRPALPWQSRTRLLPYSGWSVRPTGGRGGATAAITLEAPNFPDPLVIEV